MKITSLMIYLSVLNYGFGMDLDIWSMILSNSYRIEEKNYYGTIIKNSFPRGNPCPYPTIKLDGLIRRHQDRQNYNRPTNISQRGLELRIKNKTERTKRQINLRDKK